MSAAFPPLPTSYRHSPPRSEESGKPRERIEQERQDARAVGILRGKRKEKDLDDLSKFFSDIGADVDGPTDADKDFDFPDFELTDSIQDLSKKCE